MASPGFRTTATIGWSTKAMVDIFILPFIIASALGFLAGLGVGGGSLLILWLTLIINTDAGQARTINLLFFLASAGTVSLFRLRSQKLPLQKILPAILTGCIASASAALLSRGIDTEILSTIFAWLLILTGLRELFYRPRKDR